MTFAAFDVGDKADTAIIVFVGWIVEALSGRHTYMGCHGWSLVIGNGEARLFCKSLVLSKLFVRQRQIIAILSLLGKGANKKKSHILRGNDPDLQ
jgi:hypothetical protein